MEIYCFRRIKIITAKQVCRQCFFRGRCRPFQLWLQPELPFTFKPGGKPDCIFDLQNGISEALDALFPAEYNLLKNRALRLLPDVEDRESAVVRLKMYELLTRTNG